MRDKQATIDTLIRAQDAYYNGHPVMSDAAYDSLADSIRSSDLGSDPDVIAALNRVGSKIPSGGRWPKYRHPVPLGSLNKAQTDAELRDWASKLPRRGLTFNVSAKCDGISLGMYYRDGRLVAAATRGDGDEGEDILPNVLGMREVVNPLPVPFTGMIRGEIVLRKSDWKHHFSDYSNPRNAASGIAKSSSDTRHKHLTVIAYEIVEADSEGSTTKTDAFRRLQSWGFTVPPHRECKTVDDVVVLYDEYIRELRERLDYDIDGLVVDIDVDAYRLELGVSSGRPNGSVAFKFPHQTAASILRDVVWQVGTTGRITPVAEFDPVHVAGAMLARATLHNVDEMASLALAAGSPNLTRGTQVIISRQNDVIPAVQEVVLHNPDGDVFLPPTECPSCTSPLVRDGKYLVCKNEDCPAQILGTFTRWVSKTGVLGAGPAVLSAWIEAGVVQDIGDLYTMDLAAASRATTADGSRVGDSVKPFVASLMEKRTMPLSTLVGSLGIPLCSRSVCKMLVDAGFDTLDKMRQASVKDLAAIHGFGPERANAFVNGLASRNTVIDKLLANGVIVTAPAIGGMTGKSFCLTGFRSPEMEQAIESAGGSVKSSVGRGLTYLVAKDPHSGSEKLKKAVSLGVKVIGIDEAWGIVKGRET